MSFLWPNKCLLCMFLSLQVLDLERDLISLPPPHTRIISLMQIKKACGTCFLLKLWQARAAWEIRLLKFPRLNLVLAPIDSTVSLTRCRILAFLWFSKMPARTPHTWSSTWNCETMYIGQKGQWFNVRFKILLPSSAPARRFISKINGTAKISTSELLLIFRTSR